MRTILSPAHLMERIRRERISVAAVVPRVLELLRAYLLSSDPRLQARLNASSISVSGKNGGVCATSIAASASKFWAFVSGGASLPAEVEQFWNALGFVLVQGYGMTETTALATLNHPFHPARGSIGKPLAGREVRVAEDGEILVRGPMLAAGTWRDGGIQPRTDDWLHTGDLGAVDASGEMRFLGRKSDVIVAASGMNIHPKIWSRLSRSRRVRDCIGRRLGVAARSRAGRCGDPAGSRRRCKPRRRFFPASNRELQEFQQIRNILRWPAN